MIDFVILVFDGLWDVMSSVDVVICVECWLVVRKVVKFEEIELC